MVSIIIPIYNKQNYIEKLMASIEKQTYQDYEIILINDGSTDASLKVCQKMCEKNKKIKLITQENQGPSGARNTGILNARGEKIIFIDADDEIEINYLEELEKASKEFDLVVCGYNLLKKSKNQNIKKVLGKDKEQIIGIKDVIQLKQKELFNNLWNKIFKTEIILKNNIKFEPQYCLGEDTLFIIEYLKHIKTNIKVLNLPLYNYTLSETGINLGTKENLEQRIERILYTKSQMYKLYEINNLKNLKQIDDEYFKTVLTLLARYIKKNKQKSFGEKRNEIKKILNKNETKQLLKNTNYKMSSYFTQHRMIITAYICLKFFNIKSY